MSDKIRRATMNEDNDPNSEVKKNSANAQSNPSAPGERVVLAQDTYEVPPPKPKDSGDSPAKDKKK